VYVHPYPDSFSTQILEEAGLKVDRILPEEL